MKSLNKDKFEHRLRTAVAQDDRALISVLLGFAQSSETPLTPEVRGIIDTLSGMKPNGFVLMCSRRSTGVI